MKNLVSNTIIKLVLVLIPSFAALSGCGKGSVSYSLLPDSQSFTQVTNVKVDILWAVDNSGSMDPFQGNMVNNFGSFISTFINKGYDFQMATTTSDAFLSGASFSNNLSLSRFRDGTDASSHTGVFVITPSTPNLFSTFVTNNTQGSAGSGDERIFSSFKEALNNPQNAGFVRPDAFLAIIILSDEDDFSDPTRPEYSWLSNGGKADHSYTNPTLETVASYKTYLDNLKGSSDANRRYNVSSIAVIDNNCLTAHQANAASSIIGQRYMQLSQLTAGITGSICDASYATSLSNIQSQIVELSTRFTLNRIPDESTLSVIVNNAVVPKDPVNGWTYSSAMNAIIFHGTQVPPQGASIQVNFVPTTVK